MDARPYADAILRLQDSVAPEKLVAGLVAALRSTGRAKLLPKILAELKAREGRKLATTPLIEVAKESETARALQGARSEGIEADSVVVNPTLLSGWRARGNGLLVDRSGKKNLVDLYLKITN